MVFPNKVKIAYGKMRGWAVFGKIQPTLGLLPRIRGKVYLNKSGELQVGKRLNIIGKPWGTQLTVVKGARLTIGNNVMIGPRTSIFDSAYHRIDSLDDGSEMAQRITIQDNAWIGTGALILPGVTIGKNAVVAAGSTVTKDVPDNTLVAGAPAKVIRELTIHDGWIRR
ncbi:DapH/DapD/GlmU-related protein [Paenibacillus xylanexedens]|uniref:DapH/DapD/GlmU-related protein n=1 Tax=Paenibacillus xylanexedens TaxID=528191 RepID=UPI0016435283|nr:DapH/DapD/GlmU-related protein [Paenibacillus xylanexedens]